MHRTHAPKPATVVDKRSPQQKSISIPIYARLTVSKPISAHAAQQSPPNDENAKTNLARPGTMPLERRRRNLLRSIWNAIGASG